MTLLHPGDKFPALTVALPDSGALRLPDALDGHFGVVLFYRGKANHFKPIHTGGTASVTTRHKPAREQATHPDHQWPQDWRNDGREPGAN